MADTPHSNKQATQILWTSTWMSLWISALVFFSCKNPDLLNFPSASKISLNVNYQDLTVDVEARFPYTFDEPAKVGFVWSSSDSLPRAGVHHTIEGMGSAKEFQAIIGPEGLSISVEKYFVRGFVTDLHSVADGELAHAEDGYYYTEVAEFAFIPLSVELLDASVQNDEIEVTARAVKRNPIAFDGLGGEIIEYGFLWTDTLPEMLFEDGPYVESVVAGSNATQTVLFSNNLPVQFNTRYWIRSYATIADSIVYSPIDSVVVRGGWAYDCLSFISGSTPFEEPITNQTIRFGESLYQSFLIDEQLQFTMVDGCNPIPISCRPPILSSPIQPRGAIVKYVSWTQDTTFTNVTVQYDAEMDSIGGQPKGVALAFFSRPEACQYGITLNYYFIGARYEMVVFSLEDRLFVGGGIPIMEPDSISNDIYVATVDKDGAVVPEGVLELEIPLLGTCVIPAGQRAYFVGGTDEHFQVPYVGDLVRVGATNTFGTFDRDGVWTDIEVPEDFKPRLDAVGIEHEGVIYVGLGRDAAGDFLSDFWSYSPSDGWERLPDLPSGRVGSAVLIVDGRVHIGGGRVSIDSEEFISGQYYEYVPCVICD